ncbi:MAG TPA: hypothetical protein VGB74_04305 [Actinoplanes sp.]|jgi:hypothetical protein
MFYGPPPRASHRAIDDGGFAALIKTIGVEALIKTIDPDGRHRQPAVPGEPHPTRATRPVRHPHLEPERAAHWLTRALATLIILGIVGMIGFVAFADSRRGEPVETVSIPAPADPLESRARDATPLTALEVFPDPERVAAPGAPYPISLINSDADCGTATVGTLGRLLREAGCSQVVRAGLTAPYGDYEVTAGLFNLAAAPGATEVSGLLRQLVETDDGGFASMAPVPVGADPSAPPSGQVGWRTRGHYLLYCVITRPDGQPLADGDPNAAQITADLVDGYLTESVLAHRGASA